MFWVLKRMVSIRHGEMLLYNFISDQKLSSYCLMMGFLPVSSGITVFTQGNLQSEITTPTVEKQEEYPQHMIWLINKKIKF